MGRASITVAVLAVLLAAGCGGSGARPVTVAQRSAAPAGPATARETTPGAIGEREGLVVVAAKGTVEAVVDRIRHMVETGGGVVTVIDHAAAARKAGLDLPPTMLLLVGNPAVGTPLMQEARTVGIDLPLKILVWEDGDGRTQVAYNDPAFLARRHGITGQDQRLAGIAATLQRLATGAGEDTLPSTR
jgi:uncharacterized protein (DUF302 family)